MSVSRAQLEELVRIVRAAVSQARSVAQGASDAQTRANELYGVATLERAVDVWATRQLEEVLAGTRTFDKWRRYAEEELVPIASRYVRDAGSIAVQFSRLALTIGEAALAVDRAVLAPVEAKVDELGKDVEKLQQRWKAFELQRKAFESPKVRALLSNELQELLYGRTAAEKRADLDRLVQLHSALKSAVSLLRTGKARAVTDGKGDFTLVEVAPNAAQLVGALPVLGAGAVLATVAVCATIVVGLYAFFSHLDTVAETELKKVQMAAATHPDPEVRKAALAAMDKQNEADRNKNKQTLFGGFEGVVLAGAALVGVAGATLVLLQIFRRKGKSKTGKRRQKGAKVLRPRAAA